MAYFTFVQKRVAGTDPAANTECSDTVRQERPGVDNREFPLDRQWATACSAGRFDAEYLRRVVSAGRPATAGRLQGKDDNAGHRREHELRRTESFRG